MVVRNERAYKDLMPKVAGLLGYKNWLFVPEADTEFKKGT